MCRGVDKFVKTAGMVAGENFKNGLTLAQYGLDNPPHSSGQGRCLQSAGFTCTRLQCRRPLSH